MSWSGFEGSGRSPRGRARRGLVVALLAAALAGSAPRAALGAQSAAAAPDGEALRVYAYTLEYQPVGEALALVRPLLSSRGTVELQPGGNTVVIRDSLAALTRIVPTLRQFDHKPETLRLEVQMVQAFMGQSGGPSGFATPLATLGSEISPALVQRLRGLLRYDAYRLHASARLDVREGEVVLYELGGAYTVGFKLGTLMSEKRVKLHDFRVARRATTGPFAQPERQLLGTNLNLWLDQTLILGLSRDESSGDALMVVVSCSRPK
jgi:hypothetical protein